MDNSAPNIRINSVVSNHDIVEVIQNKLTKQRSLHATVSFAKGTVICEFSAGEIFRHPNYLTIQTGLQEHISLLPFYLQYTNHSCNPNIFFDTKEMKVIALKNIAPKEELCFFYPSTEYEMAAPFLCYCGTKDCLRNIRGAKFLPAHILNQYKVTDFIKQQMNTHHS